MSNHTGVIGELPERFTMTNGVNVYVGYDEKSKKVYACIAPDVETNPLVKVHQTVTIHVKHTEQQDLKIPY